VETKYSNLLSKQLSQLEAPGFNAFIALARCQPLVMSEELLSTLQRELEEELMTESMVKLDPDLYSAVAIRIREIRESMGNGDSAFVNKLLEREIQLFTSMAEDLLKVRLLKFLDRAMKGANEISLTPEERYMVEPMYDSVKRLLRIREALYEGHPSVLEESSDSYSVKYIAVRFLQHSPKMAGIDSKQYGPYRKEDLAVIPIDNAKPLLERGVVAEAWVSQI
jgi:DNA replication factor GINS